MGIKSKLSLWTAMICVIKANRKRERQIDPYEIVHWWPSGMFFGDLPPSQRAFVIKSIGIKNYFIIRNHVRWWAQID